MPDVTPDAWINHGATDTAAGVGAGEPGAGDVAGGDWLLAAEVVGVGVSPGVG
jgi:hypothetical protein